MAFKKGTPQYYEWLRKYQEKRGKNGYEEDTPKTRREPKTKMKELFTPEQMGELPENVLPKGTKRLVHSNSQNKDLEIEVIRYTPSAKKYLVHREDGKYLYYSEEQMSKTKPETAVKHLVEYTNTKKDSVSIVPEGSQSAKIEKTVAPVTYDMMMEGLHIDLDAVKTKKAEVLDRLESIKKELFDKAGGEFNYKNPKASAEVLYDKLGLPQIAGRSTSADVLTKLAEATGNDVPSLISNARSQDKLIVSYLDKFERIASTGDGNLRNSFSPATVSGRFSTLYNPRVVEVPDDIQTEPKVYFQEDLDDIGLGSICPL